MQALRQPLAFSPGTLIRRHPLATFFVLAYAFSWGIAVPLIAAARGASGRGVPLALHYLTAYGPLLAAFVVTAVCDGRAGVRDLGQRMFRWRVGVRWWLWSVMSLLIIFGLAVIIARALGQPLVDWRRLGEINYLPNLGAAAWVLWIVTSGFGEETGWRGFALPRLQNGHSALAATLLLSAGWALWHLPFFFYLDTYVQMGWGMFPAFALGMTAGAIVCTWLYNSTGGSILMLALWHGTLNFVTGSAASEGLIAPINTILIMVWAAVLVPVYTSATLSRQPKQIR